MRLRRRVSIRVAGNPDDERQGVMAEQTPMA
jgi:hypothetical protein